jgi:hypothetical protein
MGQAALLQRQLERPSQPPDWVRGLSTVRDSGLFFSVDADIPHGEAVDEAEELGCFADQGLKLTVRCRKSSVRFVIDSAGKEENTSATPVKLVPKGGIFHAKGETRDETQAESDFGCFGVSTGAGRSAAGVTRHRQSSI